MAITLTEHGTTEVAPFPAIPTSRKGASRSGARGGWQSKSRPSKNRADRGYISLFSERLRTEGSLPAVQDLCCFFLAAPYVQPIRTAGQHTQTGLLRLCREKVVVTNIRNGAGCLSRDDRLVGNGFVGVAGYQVRTAVCANRDNTQPQPTVVDLAADGKLNTEIKSLLVDPVAPVRYTGSEVMVGACEKNIVCAE